jgi:hypothetical protein
MLLWRRTRKDLVDALWDATNYGLALGSERFTAGIGNARYAEWRLYRRTQNREPAADDLTLT